MLIRNIDRYQRLADLTFLCEFRTGKGRVVLSGLRFDAAAWEDSAKAVDPSRHWMLQRLIVDVTGGDASALPEVPAAFLIGDRVTVPKGPLVEGLDPASIAGGEAHVGPTHRGPNRPIRVVRQGGAGQTLTWRSPPVAQVPAEGEVHFVIPGGNGFSSQPAGGFTLSINGKPRVQFDHTLKGGRWTEVRDATNFVGEARLATLQFVSLWPAPDGQDAWGLWVVSLPAADVRQGQPVEFSVAPTNPGTGSQRWFGLTTDADAAVEAARVRDQ
jgi:hypothetical protein